jgi:hypothetical protein
VAGESEKLGENLPQFHFFPVQIPHDLIPARTLAAVLASQRISA